MANPAEALIGLAGFSFARADEEEGHIMSDNTDVPAETLSRRQALKTYVPPAITVIGLANATSLRSSGPIFRTRKGNNGFGQEKQGAPKDGPPAGKPKNDKPGPR